MIGCYGDIRQYESLLSIYFIQTKWTAVVSSNEKARKFRAFLYLTMFIFFQINPWLVYTQQVNARPQPADINASLPCRGKHYLSIHITDLDLTCRKLAGIEVQEIVCRNGPCAYILCCYTIVIEVPASVVIITATERPDRELADKSLAAGIRRADPDHSIGIARSYGDLVVPWPEINVHPGGRLQV